MKNIFANPDKGAGWFNAGQTLLNLLKKAPALALLGFNISIKLCKLMLSLAVERAEAALNKRRGLVTYDTE